jgi:hypothetical protein
VVVSAETTLVIAHVAKINNNPMKITYRIVWFIAAPPSLLWVPRAPLHIRQNFIIGVL